MKIISSKQSQALDKATMKAEPISSLQLMERAGQRITKQLLSDYGKESKYVILCGDGNNGGDGLVIARLLHLNGCNVKVYIRSVFKNKSPENLENLKALKSLNIAIDDFNDLIEHNNTIWIDALFGSGLSRPLEGKWKNIVQTVNKYKGKKIAIDIPSGLYADKLPTSDDIIFKSDKTYTIGQPKLTFFLPETAELIGDFTLIDIDLDNTYLQKLETSYFYTSLDDIREIYKPRKRFSHKGTYGHALIIGGSYGKMGAPLMATRATLKSGAGLATSYVPNCGYNIMQISIPEAICITDANDKSIESFPNVENYDSIGLGCGLGQTDKTQKAFYKWLQQTQFGEKPLVIDADGLNLLSKEKQILHHLPSQIILTPHPKEFERLTQKPMNSLQRLEIAQEFAKQYKIILILKDAITCIINTKGQVYFNPTGNAGLATGGSGDTLTGIITGLLAQGYTTIDASRLSVWLHGKSADIGVEQESMESFTATDIDKYLGAAFKSIEIK